MLLKNHKTMGQMYFDDQEQFEKFLTIHKENPEILKEDFLDVSEEEIEKYIAKVEWDNTNRFELSRKIRRAKKTATRRAQHYDMMGMARKAKEWRSYYQKIYKLTDNEEWPEEPEDSEGK